MRSGITDITEHPTGEGKLYCCVVLAPTRAGGRLVDRRHQAASW